MITKTFLLLTAFCVASCATISEKAEPTLVGQWRWADRRHTAEYVFLRDGTFTGFVTSDGALLSRFTGKWRVREGAILYEYTSDKMGRIEAGTKDRDKLLAAAHDHFVIEAADGSVRKYLRVNGG